MSELPKVKIGRKTYYVDVRLAELRNVDNPHDRIEMGRVDNSKRCGDLDCTIPNQCRIDNGYTKHCKHCLCRNCTKSDCYLEWIREDRRYQRLAQL